MPGLGDLRFLAPTFSKGWPVRQLQPLTSLARRECIVPMGILFTAVFSGIEIIWDRQFGFLKETLVAPVSRIGIVLGRVLGGANSGV